MSFTQWCALGVAAAGCVQCGNVVHNRIVCVPNRIREYKSCEKFYADMMIACRHNDYEAKKHNARMMKYILARQQLEQYMEFTFLQQWAMFKPLPRV